MAAISGSGTAEGNEIAARATPARNDVQRGWPHHPDVLLHPKTMVVFGGGWEGVYFLPRLTEPL